MPYTRSGEHFQGLTLEIEILEPLRQQWLILPPMVIGLVYLRSNIEIVGFYSSPACQSEAVC